MNVGVLMKTLCIMTLVTALRASSKNLGLSSDDEAALRSDVDTLDAQLNSPRPKSSIITECKTSIRTILEGAASALVAAPLLKLLVG